MELVQKGIPQHKISNIFDCLEISEGDYVFESVEELIQAGYSEAEAKEEPKEVPVVAPVEGEVVPATEGEVKAEETPAPAPAEK